MCGKVICGKKKEKRRGAERNPKRSQNAHIQVPSSSCFGKAKKMNLLKDRSTSYYTDFPSIPNFVINISAQYAVNLACILGMSSSNSIREPFTRTGVLRGFPLRIFT